MGDELRDLVDRAQRGDKSALGEIYDQYRPRIYRYAAYRLGVGDRAEDATSEVFAQMLTSLRSFRWREGATFSSWLFRIAHNVVAYEFRKAGRAREVPLEDRDWEDRQGDPEAAEVSRVERETMKAHLASLPEDQQQVLLLRIVTGLSASEVGAVLGKSEGAIRVAQFRALAALRKVMGAAVP